MTREEQIEQTAYRYAVKRQEDPNFPVYNLETEITDAFIKGAEYADQNPDLYSVTRKAVEREREYLIRKACKWLDEYMEDKTRSYNDYDVHDVVASDYAIKKEFIEAFKKAMED